MAHWCDIGVNMPDNRLPAESVVQAAQAADVQLMLLTGTSIGQSREALALAKQYSSSLFCTAGIHPHYAKDAGDFEAQICELAKHSQVLAIGECGLDFNRNFSPRQDQLDVFERQLVLAVKLQLPVFLHERDAFEEQLALLDRYRDDLVGGVAHCFTSDLEQMQGYLERDLYIGITGWLCDDKRGQALQQAVTQLPLNRVLLETDAPYLMPKTLKNQGRTNQPANLPHVAEFLATLMKVELEELKQASWRNAHALFSFPTGTQ